ncbi:MAG: SusC/RagA family TonB-linked outer membrane protein [Balneolaceae bacterium]
MKRTKRRLFRDIGLSGVLFTIMGLQPVCLNAQQAPSLYERDATVQAMRLSQLEEKFYKTEIPQEIVIAFENLTVEEALRSLASQTGLRLSYRGDIIPDRRVNLKSRDIRVSDALDFVLKDTGLDYRFSREGYLLITEKNATPIADAIQQTVRGIVLDAESGEPLPGVNILIEGTSTGTTTDGSGEFELTVPDLNDTLVFTYIGYDRQEVPIANQSEMTIRLAPDVQMFEDVVVIGYGTVQREELTSSVSSVDSDDFITGAVNDPIQMIDGKVPGLTMGTVAAGDPNAGSSLQVRGMASVNAGTGPLIVVDGVPGRDLTSIPKDEIESITVLKDGASSAIYGARGANGVVIVTTKGGRDREPSVSYNGHLSINTVANKPEALSAEEFVANGRSTQYDPSQANSLPHSNNFYDLLIQDAAAEQYHNIAVDGGGETSSYRVSMNYRDSDGIDLVSNRRDYGVRLNFNQRFRERVGVRGNIYANKSNRIYTNYEAFNQAIKVRPTEPLFDAGGIDYQLFSGHQYFNPVALLEYNRNQGERVNLSGDVTFQVDVTDDLTTSLLIAENYVDSESNYFTSSKSRESRDNQYSGRAQIGNSKSSERVLEWTANYMVDYDLHSAEILAGYSYQDFEGESATVWNADFASDALLWNNLGGGSYHSTSGGQVAPASSKNSSKLIGFFGRVNYNFDRTWLLTASLRREGSSKFGANNKWGMFPGLSVGWVPSNMSFFDDIGAIDYLKLRASYGVTGREDISSLLSIPTYGIHSSYYMGSGWLQSWGPSGNPNPNLKWETSVNTNIGFDLTMLDNRLDVSLDLYNRETRDLLFYTPTPKPPSIYGNTWSNVGSIRNRGVEMVLDLDVIQSQELNFTTSLVGSYGKSTMLKINDSGGNTTNYIDQYTLPAPGNPGPIVRLEEGQEIGSFHMYKHAGIDENGNFQIYNADGDVILAQNKSESDKQFVGNGTPDITMSWTNNVEYRNFDLSLYFRGAFLWDVVNLHQMYYGLQNTPGNVLKSAYGRNSAITAEKEASSYFMERGDYVSLRNLTLGYTIPSESVNNLFRRARVFLSARNLFTITNSTVTDPTQIEVNGLTPGIQPLSFYPSTRAFTLGVQLTF